MYRLITISFISLLFSVSIFSCKTVDQRKAIKDCKFGLESVAVEGISLDNIRLKISILVANPNDIKAVVDRFEYLVYDPEENLLGKGEHTEKLEIEPYQKGFLNLSLAVSNQELGKALLKSALTGGMDITVKGVAHVETWIGTFDFPFEETRKLE
jgi:LEA14-like dessication related protein